MVESRVAHVARGHNDNFKQRTAEQFSIDQEVSFLCAENRVEKYG